MTAGCLDLLLVCFVFPPISTPSLYSTPCSVSHPRSFKHNPLTSLTITRSDNGVPKMVYKSGKVLATALGIASVVSAQTYVDQGLVGYASCADYSAPKRDSAD